MKGIIGFKNHQIDCIIGIGSSERQQARTIFVDLKVSYDFKKCSESENIKDTVDYVTLAKICSELATKKKYKLLETFAFDIINQLKTQFKLDWVWVKVKKPEAIDSVEYTFVEMEG